MGFVIVTTISPEFERAEKEFLPTWHANSGADDIVVHRIDEGTWAKNICRRAEIVRKELMERLPCGEKVLALDADCLVLKDLSGGFSDRHIMSVARWPNVNMGVLFFNLGISWKWHDWLRDTVALIRQEASRPGRKPTHECDQVVWRPRLQAMPDKIMQLAEWEWNYNNFELAQWRRELPGLRDIVRVLHIKGHGDFEYACLDQKLEFAKRLWPRELRCIG
jgi:hypothetical protein